MSQELIGIIIAAIALAAILVPGQWALRRDMADLRKDIAALGERTQKDIAALGDRVGKVELGLVERIGKLESNLGDRISKVEGLVEGFTRSSPQSTPQ